MERSKLAGLAVAAAAAALFASGCASPGSGSSSMMAKVHCQGVNGCKGQSECASANSSCKGQNSCKGQGWTSMSASDCEKAGGHS